jgi:hypothetical protein
MTFRLRIKCNTPAFVNREPQEVCRILRGAADCIQTLYGYHAGEGWQEAPLFDADGIQVGSFSLSVGSKEVPRCPS